MTRLDTPPVTTAMLDTASVPATTPSHKRGPYSKSTVRRREILDAAMEVFSTYGYRSGSLKDVAAKVGINQTSIFHYFPTKQALFEAVLDYKDAASDAVIAEIDSTDPHSYPAKLLHLAEYNNTIPGLIEMYTLMTAESTIPGHPSADYFRARAERIRTLFRNAFLEMDAAGLLREGVDPVFAGSTFLGLWDGIQVQWLLDPSSVDVVEHLRRYLGSVVNFDF